MKFFHRFTEWKDLKNKNIVLNDENDRLASQNMLFNRQSRAFEIENFKSGREIARLREDCASLTRAYEESQIVKMDKGQVLENQQALTFLKPVPKEQK